MKTSLLCISSGNPLTMPGVEQRPEGFRIYQMARPGERLYWGENDHGEPRKEKIDVPKVYRPPCGMEFGYGLIVLEDLRYLWDNPIKNLVIGHPEATLETKIVPCTELAGDLLGKQSQFGWWNFGVMQLAGDTPTEAEIQRAISTRLDFGHRRVNDAISNYQEAQAGKAKHATYALCDSQQPKHEGDLGGWAWEMGKRLPNTWEALEKIKDNVSAHSNQAVPSLSLESETANCPQCVMPVHPDAKMCRWCKSPITAEAKMPPPVENKQQVKVLR